MSELSDKQLPSQHDVEDALFKFLCSRPSGVETKTVYRELADIMGLSPGQLTERRESEGRNLWQNLVRYAHRRLKDHGKVNDGPRGLWTAKE